MNTLLKILLVAFSLLIGAIVVAVVASAFTVHFINGAKPGLITEEQPAPQLVGQSFSLQYFPVDPENAAAQGVAARFNRHAYRITFESDSTYLQQSNKYLNQYRWSRDGDQVTLNNHSYTIDNLILRDSLFQIQLTPLR